MPLFNSTVNNSVTQSGPLAGDASFQLVDVRDLGTIDLLLKRTPHGVVNRVEVWSVIGGQRAGGIKSFKHTLNYCVDGSIWHFKCPKVVQAQTLGEVGIPDSVLLRISPGTILAIFIEIGSYLTEKEQKISWHSFFRHSVLMTTTAVDAFFCITGKVVKIAQQQAWSPKKQPLQAKQHQSTDG